MSAFEAATMPSAPDDGVVIGRPTKSLFVGWVAGNVSLNVVWGAVASVLVAVQIQRVDPDLKVARLALLTSVAAVVSIVVQPLVGYFSDRTRTRIGRRAPWIIAGCIVGAAGLLAMSTATSFVPLLGCYLVVVLGFALAGLPFQTALAERVPVDRRGTYSALAALGAFVGNVGGQALAAALAGNLRAAYLSTLVLTCAGLLLFVALNPERLPAPADTPTAPSRERRRVLTIARTVWITPLRHHDLRWVLLGRLLLGLGFFSVTSFNLYLLQGYLGLDESSATAMIPVLAGSAGIAAGISTLVFGPLWVCSQGRTRGVSAGLPRLPGRRPAAPSWWPSRP